LPRTGRQFITSFDVRWGEIMAMGTLATVPVVVLFLSVQRYFLRGVLSGLLRAERQLRV
jgi:ABC-type glycerol-3-phosphate transport system permease component